MAHNLATQANGQAALAYVGELPWHGLGTKVEGIAMTAADAIAAAGLDWTVETVPTQTYDGYPLKTFAIRRQDNGAILGEGASKRYTLVQNHELFEFFDPVVGAGEAIYHTVGALGAGEVVWVLAKLPTSVIVAGKDVHEKWLLLSNSHTPGKSLKVGFTTVRVVCQNTYNQALRGDEILKFAHFGNITGRLETAKADLGIVNKHYDDLGKLFNALATRPVSVAALGDFFAQVFPEPAGKSEGAESRRRQALADRDLATRLFETGVGQDLFPGSAYNAINAVTELTTHFPGRRKGEAHLADLLFGGEAFKAQQRALQAASLLVR